LRTRLSIPDTARVVLCAGRFSREKGHADLIRAIAEIPESGEAPEFRLVLAGDGPERPNLESLAASLGVAGRVIFAGYQQNLAAYYAMADVFALPSHSEGSPNALLEAMSAGLALAATEVGGVPEIVEHGRTALLVPKADSAALGCAIGDLLRDDSLRARLGSEARGAADRFSPEAYCNWMLRLYNDVLSGAGIGSVH
jgi:glycosyltransferase involved in cell wall biosynthesis